ncbi:DNA helicase [Tanacetum coccineum]|uniref:ATP-dependent DNA helicase n=1 Tax=Tanacetum coccineum TaxID=301880 RepID=A0ABQ5AYA6_9ASTR
MKGKQSHTVISSDFSKWGKQTLYNFYKPQNPGTREPFDNASSGCISTFVGVGVGSDVYGGTPAFQGVFSFSASSSPSSHDRNTQLYLDVFGMYNTFYGGTLRQDSITAFRVISRAQDAELYLDVFKKYSQCCGGTSRHVSSTTFTDPMSVATFIHNNAQKQKLYTDATADPFRSYSSLCLANAGKRRIVHSPQIAPVSPLQLAVTHGSKLLQKDITLHATDSNIASDHVVPSVSNPQKRTASNSQLMLTTAEASTSKPTRRFPSRNNNMSGRHSGELQRINRQTHTEACSSATTVGRSYTYVDLGDSTQRCRYCGASFWYGERLKGRSHGQRVEYHLCCSDGRIYMQQPPEPPEYIKQLFQNKHFMENIRAYNQMFAMTSFGAKIDESINAGKGPYVFKVSGQVYHWIGSLCPTVGETPKFLQLYIYDTENEVANRMSHFGGVDDSRLDPQIVEGLIHFLDAHNELVQLFRTARDKCREMDIPEFKIRLYNAEGARGYELPTSNTLGAMVFESGIKSKTDFDVIIKYKDGLLQRVNKLHLSYMSLQFPLLFIHGQSGYHTKLKLRSADGNRKAKRVTMLTRSKIYPEIKRFMAQYPELTPADWADVVCRIFEQKLEAFITFLKEERTFGNVTGGLASKIRMQEQVDQFIFAELPDPSKDPDRYRVVSELMMHDPCGVGNLKASCMKASKCSKNFPKKYNPKTYFDDNGNVHYQRRDANVSTTRHQFKLDNRQSVFSQGRFICAHEAYWRIFKFDIRHREPAVQILAVHLEDMQRVTFKDRDRIESIVNLPGKKNTTLTEWFAYNASNQNGRHLTYLDFPSEFVWYGDSKTWSPRRNCRSSIGRLAYVHPTSGELFFLRMLLCHQKGCRDFKEVQTIGHVLYPTYRAACEAMGLLGDDREWEIALEEACVSVTSPELRSLFCHILLYCDVADPRKLWTMFWKEMCHDIPKRVSDTVQIPNYHLDDNAKQGYILLLMEERNYNRVALMHAKNEYVPRLNNEQRIIYDLITDASANNWQELLFVYGHGGTGKTFLWKTLISALRSEGKIVLAVASSDEAPMNDRGCFEALDRNLRDILNASFSLFEGKSVVLGGDIRQTLLVKKGASKMEVISSCISESELWLSFKVFTLKENMRLARPDISLEERSLANSFASWLLDIGDGKIGETDEKDPENTSWIDIPPQYCVPPDEQGLSNLIDFIYDQSTLHTPSATTLQQKAIVCPKNEIADIINSKVLDMVSGESITYISNDEATPTGSDGAETEMLYPVEHLNTLKLPGFPPHELKLKVGAPVMLLRNINLAGGLCNGTRMIVTQLMTKLIEVQIITGTRVGEKVFIHRISLNHKDPNLPFIFKRRQFPIKLCYAMTINKRARH